MTLTNNFETLFSGNDFPDFAINNKRPCTSLDEFVTVNGQRQKHENKFLLVTLSRSSPFLVQKGLDMITKGLKNIKKLRSGQILVETRYSNQVEKLLKATTLAGILPITVKLHPHLNTSKGTVYAPDLIDLSEEILTEELKDQKVVEVKRIRRLPNAKDDPKKKDKDGLVKTPLLIITFDMTLLPKKLKAGYLMLNVEHYIPNPMRCKQCHHFGHTKRFCSADPSCARCSLEFNELHPEGILCTNNPRCANCHGAHEAFRKTCKRYKDEYAISKIKTLDRITYHEAKQKFEQYNVSEQMLPMAYALKNANQTLPTSASHVSARKPSPSQPQSSTPIISSPSSAPPNPCSSSCQNSTSSVPKYKFQKPKSPTRQHVSQSPKKQHLPAKEKPQSDQQELTAEQRQNLKEKIQQQIEETKQNLRTKNQQTINEATFALPHTGTEGASNETDYESSSSTKSIKSNQSRRKSTRNKKNKNVIKDNNMDTN